MNKAQFIFWINSLRFQYPLLKHTYLITCVKPNVFMVRIYLNEGYGDKATHYYFEATALAEINIMFNNNNHVYSKNINNQSDKVGTYTRVCL